MADDGGEDDDDDDGSHQEHHCSQWTCRFCQRGSRPSQLLMFIAIAVVGVVFLLLVVAANVRASVVRAEFSLRRLRSSEASKLSQAF